MASAASGWMAASSPGVGHPAKGPTASARVQIVVADRVPSRRVGPDEGGMDEERPVAVPLQPVDDLLAQERRLRQLDREARGGPGRPVRVCAGEPLNGLVEIVGVGGDVDALCGEPAAPRRAPLLPGVLDQDPESRQDPLVAEEPRVTGRHRARIDRGVRVPEEDRVVPQLPRHQRHVREARVQRGPVEDGTVPVLIGTRVETRPRRAAGRRVGPVVREEHAPCCQCVENRRLHHRMAEGRKAVTAPLVECDEQHAAGRRHAATLADQRGLEPRRPTGRRGTRPPQAQDVRTDAPPSLVPNSISQEPTRGATARRTARPPATGSPVAERCVAPESLIRATGRRAVRLDPAPAISSCLWVSAWVCTALAWIIDSPLWTLPLPGLLPLQASLHLIQCLTTNQEYPNIAVCLCSPKRRHHRPRDRWRRLRRWPAISRGSSPWRRGPRCRPGTRSSPRCSTDVRTWQIVSAASGARAPRRPASPRCRSWPTTPER